MKEDSLGKYRHDLQFLREMAEQTAIDLERFGYEISFDPLCTVSFENYRLQLENRLATWCKSDPARIPALLYHIDIPEHLLPPGYGCKDASRLAELILQRELIKVVLRKQFKS